MTKRLYNEHEDNFILLNYLTMSDQDIATRICRSIRSVGSRMQLLGLRKFKTIPFTPEEDIVILAGTARTSVDIGKQLNRVPSVVRMRARRLGIPNWKQFTGGLQDHAEYKVVCVRLRNGKRQRLHEHQHVMEQSIGRMLTEEERVHHINLNKRDNGEENLYLCANQSAHNKVHHSLERLVPELLERGLIYFNRSDGTYRITEPLSIEVAA